MPSLEALSQPDPEAGTRKMSSKRRSTKSVQIDMAGAVNLDATDRTHTETSSDTIYSIEDWELDTSSPSRPVVRKSHAYGRETEGPSTHLAIEEEDAELRSDDKEIRPTAVKSTPEHRQGSKMDASIKGGTTPHEKRRLNYEVTTAIDIVIDSEAELESDEESYLANEIMANDPEAQVGTNDTFGLHNTMPRYENRKSRRGKTDKESIFENKIVETNPTEELRRLRKELEKRDRELEESNHTNKSLTDTNKSLAERLEEFHHENKSLAERLSTIGIKKRISGIRIGPSLRFQLIVAFTAGFFGYSPPLWFEFARALEWIACCGCKQNDPSESNDGDDASLEGSEDNHPQLGSKKQIWSRLRLVIFVVIFLVDFTDSIVDFYVSFQEAMGDSPADPSKEMGEVKGLRRWAIWLFLATAIGRTLGGTFAAFYHRIEKADRERTYVLVEMTIFCVEDMAALGLLWMKKLNCVEWTQLDYANYYLTLGCCVLFVVPMLCSCNIGLPPLATVFIMVPYSIAFIFCLIRFFSTIYTEDFGDLSESNILYLYIIAVTMQLCLLANWTRYLWKKNKQDDENNDADQQSEDEVDSMERGIRPRESETGISQQ